MKKSMILVVCMFFLVSTALFAQNKYVGAAKCKMCHQSADKGNQYAQWSSSKHSKAVDALKTEEAKKIGKAKGIADPSTDAKCLKCHATASAVDASLLDGLTVADGVSCESCHGPGSNYKAPAVMKVLADAKAKGLIIPTEDVCKKCHNAESPTFKSFDFKTYSEKISHKNPKK